MISVLLRQCAGRTRGDFKKMDKIRRKKHFNPGLRAWIFDIKGALSLNRPGWCNEDAIDRVEH